MRQHIERGGPPIPAFRAIACRSIDIKNGDNIAANDEREREGRTNTTAGIPRKRRKLHSFTRIGGTARFCRASPHHRPQESGGIEVERQRVRARHGPFETDGPPADELIAPSQEHGNTVSFFGCRFTDQVEDLPERSRLVNHPYVPQQPAGLLDIFPRRLPSLVALPLGLGKTMADIGQPLLQLGNSLVHQTLHVVHLRLGEPASVFDLSLDPGARVSQGTLEVGNLFFS